MSRRTPNPAHTGRNSRHLQSLLEGLLEGLLNALLFAESAEWDARKELPLAEMRYGPFAIFVSLSDVAFFAILLLSVSPSVRPC